MNIPVFHDDQHGTSIIVGSALLNALQLNGKKIDEIKIVASGAGAAALSCLDLLCAIGAKKENIIVADSRGLLTTKREGLDDSKKRYVQDVEGTQLADVIAGADMFLGLSAAGILTKEMVKLMAKDPIIFALANPDPEILPEHAHEVRDDVIMATGRSDYPNQVNNALCFPYIFRGALDVGATTINEEMKVAATKAIADLAKQPVPEEVNLAYNTSNLKFSADYIIPKPNDPRLITEVSVAVAKAAIASGVAKHTIEDWDKYRETLRKRLGQDDAIMRNLTMAAKRNPKRVVFAEADNYKTLRAAQIVKEEGIAIPILLGKKGKINALINEYSFDLAGVQIIDPFEEMESERVNQYVEHLFVKRQRRGLSKLDAKKLLIDRNYFGASMVQFGDADTLISGLTKNYANTIKPAIHVIGAKEGSRIAGMYMMLTKKGPIFLGDTTVIKEPSAKELADITVLLDKAVRKMNVSPRIALLSYSNFGSNEGNTPTKVREAIKIVHQEHPEIVADGDLQANFALNSELLEANFPFSTLKGQPANTLVFPNLESGNIAYKLLQEVGNAEAVGPILLGMNKPVHVLQLDSSVREIVNMVTIAVVDVQSHEKQGN
jgi:malate dehydrogenase (oxaloacetate-decarboxylating)(NADP+)